MSLADQAIPLADVCVRIYKQSNTTIIYEDFYRTDESGKTMHIPLYVSDAIECLEKDQMECPYEIYHVELRRQGFLHQKILGVQIIAKQQSYLPIIMQPAIPLLHGQTHVAIDSIPAHMLPQKAKKAMMHPPFAEENLQDITKGKIPAYIMVHLGEPDQAAENLRVPFLYYLKNVASSKLYPTLPYAVLKTNIWAQAAFLWKRLYTNDYRKAGYDFDITASADMDMPFVKNRNLWITIDRITEEVVDEFLQLQELMPQSGVIDGEELEVIKNRHEKPVARAISFDLMKLLLHITNYHPKMKRNVADKHSSMSNQMIQAFQSQFHLLTDGILHASTYHEIIRIHTVICRLEEMLMLPKQPPVLISQDIKMGSQGVAVSLLQSYLSGIALFQPSMMPVKNDAIFGPHLQEAIIAFQEALHLPKNSMMTSETWRSIQSVFHSLLQCILPDSMPPPYPINADWMYHDKGTIQALQNALTIISNRYPAIPTVIADGMYATRTKQAIKEFQKLFLDNEWDELDRDGWDALFLKAQQLNHTGVVTKVIDEADDTVRPEQKKQLLKQLTTIAQYYKKMPALNQAGTFDVPMEKAVLAFQQLLGLPADGRLDPLTKEQIVQMYEELIQ